MINNSDNNHQWILKGLDGSLVCNKIFTQFKVISQQIISVSPSEEAIGSRKGKQNFRELKILK
jgi:hypothetical protein